VREPLAGSATSPPYTFDVPIGSSQPVLRVRRVTGTVRFIVTYPDGGWSLTPDLSAASVPANYYFPAGSGGLTLTVENRTASPASFTAEVGFTTPDGWNTFRVTTPLTYLGLAQNSDGGWGIQPGRDSHFMITAETLRALGAWRQVFAGQQVLQSALTWLRSRQNPDGGFTSEPGASNPHDTSLATLAILAADPAASLANTASYLKNAQLHDGSWTSNAHQTALAIQALRMPPVVNPIPNQSVTVPAEFAQIPLDDFVTDPDHTDAEIA
jgi:hypothetical protein